MRGWEVFGKKTGYETDMMLLEESAKTLYVLQLYAAEKVSRYSTEPA